MGLTLFEGAGLREELASTRSSATSKICDLGQVSSLLRVSNAHISVLISISASVWSLDSENFLMFLMGLVSKSEIAQ